MRKLVDEVQTELAGSGDHDGRPRHFRDAYNDSSVGPALPAGVREALAALRSTRRRIVEDGRDLYKGSRTMGVLVPRRRQSGPNSRFLSQPEPGRERRQIVSAQCDEEQSRAHQDHVGRLCGLAPGGVREMKEDGELPSRVKVRSSQYLNNLVELGPSESEATNPADAGIQAIRQRGGNDLRNRASREDQDGAAQDGQARRVRCDNDETVERGTRRLSAIRDHLQGGA